MEDLAEVQSHPCSKCTLVENENMVAVANLSKMQNLLTIQAVARIKRMVSVIFQIVLAAVSVALLSEGSIREGVLMLLLTCFAHFAFEYLTNIEDTIIELGVYTLPGFAGHMMWYGFICTDCGEESWDYVHGHDAYMICRSCKVNLHVISSRFYTNDDRPAPSVWRQLRATLRFWWKTRKTPTGISRT